MSWRLIEEIDNDVYRNLAIDESLVRTSSSQDEKVNTLRFWRSDSAVVIGRFQCVHEEVNLAFCDENQIAIARRFTALVDWLILWRIQTFSKRCEIGID